MALGKILGQLRSSEMQHRVFDFDEEELAKPVGSLLVALGLVKRTPVTYLELQEYSPVYGPRDVYNDAVVNIFTRLNSAGRVLTSEDITFAWLKIGWNTAVTQGNSASRCFELLGEKLQTDDLSLSTEDLVSAVSVLWAVIFNGGKLLTNNDLLKADVIRSMAGNISENWSVVEEAMEDVSEIVRARGLRYQEHYQSLRAMQFLWACYFAALIWRKEQTSLKETDRDALKKGLRDLLDATVDHLVFGLLYAASFLPAPVFIQRLSSAMGFALCVA